MKTIDYYGTKDNYIHLKFGDMRKMYNFTKEFEKERPNFCKEYKNYFIGEKSIFNNGLEIANYINAYDIPVALYFNFTDEPVKDMTEVYEYFIREWLPYGRDYVKWDTVTKGYGGWDGEKTTEKMYSVKEIINE